MVLYLLRLRLRALGRIAAGLTHTEPFAAFSIAVGLAFLGWQVATRLHEPTGRWALAAINAGLILVVHAARRDEGFLRVAAVAHRRLFAGEYLLLSLPFALALVLSGSPLPAMIGAAAALLVPLFPTGMFPPALVQRAQRSAPIPIPVPAASFEWIAGLRRSGPVVLVLYGMAALLFRSPAALVAVLLLALIPLSFYQDAEGSALVEAFGLPAERFLGEKIVRAVTLFWLLAAPVAILLVLRHPRLWPMPTLTLAAGAVLLAGAVLTKYAVYREGSRAAIAVPLGVAAVAVTLVVPPVTVLLLHQLWKRSVRTLQPYLYAFD